MCTVLFVVLFYDEDLGLNFGILGMAYAALTYFHTKKTNHTRTFFILLVTTVLSSLAFAWYADAPSFVALVSSVLLLTFKAKNKNMKPIFAIPVFIVNGFTFICRVFSFEDWLPKSNTGKNAQKLIAFILIPAFFLIIFFAVYTLGSQNFANIFKNYELDLDVWQFIVHTVLGFFLAFNYWNFAVEKFFYRNHHNLDNNFRPDKQNIKPTYDFLDIDFERSGGVLTFVLLNVLLLFFIGTYNYEQFYVVSKLPHQLSEDTHERVYAVILSIVMAVFVILFYFKSSFNFDEKAGFLKTVAKIWIVLNGVLVLSAMAKNTEYIMELGLTYKRLGVYAFLLLSLVGLYYAFIKIKNQKTNAYLFNTMFWYFYGTVLAASFINWGNLATIYNIENKKGDFPFMYSLNYNEELLFEKYPKEMENTIKDMEVSREKNKRFLSKILYYQFININKSKK